VSSERTLSIVIITKDTKALLRDLLVSIERDRSLAPHLREITVVDNGSVDGTEAMVSGDFPSVSLVRNDTNRGFAASANAGFRHSSGDFILFLNSDTLLIEGEAVKMVRHMKDNDHVGIMGPQLVYPDMRSQRSSARTPSILFELFPRSLVERLLDGARAENRPADDPREVDSLIGAAIMVRREALEEVGGFDERFFFFLEETDLCVRMGRSGHRIVLFPGAKVVHLQGKTVRKDWVRGRLEYNISMYKFICKHHSWPYYRSFQSIRLAKALVFLAVLAIGPGLLFGERTRRTYRYYAGLVRWHLKGCPDDGGLRPAASM
jgi:N-acetylglucosaminyl-diphospho-decaprenol L-rhamnosyltransferase